MFEMRLDKETVMRGEPIVLTHRTRMLPSQSLSRSYTRDWLEIVLEDATGTPIPLSEEGRRPGSQHSHGVGYPEAGCREQTKNAANLLTEVWGRPGDPHFDWIRVCLIRLHEKGSPALKRHVEDIFRRRNLPLPR